MKIDANNLNKEELMSLRATAKSMSAQDKLDLIEVLEERQRRQSLKDSRTNMIDFARRVYPGFKVGPHHSMDAI